MKLIANPSNENKMTVTYNADSIETITINYTTKKAMQQGITLLCRLIAKGDGKLNGRNK